MNQSSLFIFQPEILQSLQKLTNEQLSIINIPEDEIKYNNLRQNAELLINHIEKELESLDKNNSVDYKFFNCYYTLLLISDKLESIVDQLQDPKNITEYVFLHYASFMLSLPLSNSLLNQKLTRIIHSNSEDDFNKRLAQIIFDIQASIITFKEFSELFILIYNDFNYDFSINPTFTSSFFRLYIFILQSSPAIIDLITFRYNKSLDLQLEFSHMLLSHILGIIYISSGRMGKGREFNEISIQISSSCDYRNQYSSKNNLALIQTLIGNYESAQEIYLELYQKFPRNIIYALNLAGNYTYLNEFEKGIAIINEFEAKVAPFKSFNNGIALDIKFRLYLRLNQLSKALEVEKDAADLEKAGSILSINKLMYYRILAQRYQYEGNLALAKQKMEDVLKIAQDLNQLKDIFDNYILLIEIQLDLVISRPNVPEFKNQLFSLIDMIIKLSDEQQIMYQKVNLLILRSEIFKHYNLYDEANLDLQEAKALAEKYNLAGSIKKVTSELSNLIKTEQLSSEIESTPTSFLKRLKRAFKMLVGSPVSNSQLKTTEYTIHGVLILTDTGLSVFNYYFSQMLESDPNLISGLILAITSFISEISKSKGILKSITHENLSLILEPIENFLCVSIASRECFEVREKTRKFASISRSVIGSHAIEIIGGIVKDEVTENLLKNVKIAF